MLARGTDVEFRRAGGEGKGEGLTKGEWARIRELLLRTLEKYPEARWAVVDALRAEVGAKRIVDGG